MPHEIDMSNGRANFAYVGDAAWHGLGQQLTPDAPLEIWLTEAGMGFEILAVPVLGMHGDWPIEMPEKHMLFRDDTLIPLAVVSNKYKVVQPREILYAQESMIEELGFKMETAGCLFGGRKFWSLSKTGNAGEVIAGDVMGQYLMLVTACDGSLATTAKFTGVRVVCNNTCSMALARGKSSVKIPHSSTFDMQKVKHELGISSMLWDQFMGDMKSLASQTMAKNESIQFLISLVGDQTKSLEDQSAGSANLMVAIHDLYNKTSLGNEMAGHTRWGMFNAVTEYVDHHTGHKSDSARMNNAWLGEGDKLKTRAAELLLEF